MPRVALATYERAPALAPDDRPLIPALAAHSVAAAPVVWNDPGARWGEFDGVIIRSCWDYHLRPAHFREWLGMVAALGVPVWNPVPLIGWNVDKRYLLDLAARGVPTLPTCVAPRDSGADAIESLAAARGWQQIVVKPAVSASGYETHALGLPFDDSAQRIVRGVAQLGDMLVQPFAPEVPRDGELSLVFLDGTFSHGARKRARAGEFRVQVEHGGSIDATQIDPRVVQQAVRALAMLPSAPLYARVDGIVRGDAFLLMELELIEPNLFLGLQPGAYDVLACAIASRLA